MPKLLNPKGFSMAEVIFKKLQREIKMSHLHERGHLLLNGPLWKLEDDQLYLYMFDKGEWVKKDVVQSVFDQEGIYHGFDGQYMALKYNVSYLLENSDKLPEYLGYISNHKDSDILTFNRYEKLEIRDVDSESLSDILGVKTSKLCEEYLEKHREITEGRER